MTDYLKSLLLLLFTFTLCAFVCEIAFRFLDYEPGMYLKKKEMANVPIQFNCDSIYVVNFYKPDSDGIIRIIQDSLSHKNIPKSSLLKKYVYYTDNVRINADGFRGNEIAINNDKKNILLCGDSYTWGYSAKPIDSCFADVLQKWMPAYNVINLGLPGTDVITYKKIIEHYLPVLHPDLVVINFFSGNDFIYYDKKLIPYKNNDVFLTN